MLTTNIWINALLIGDWFLLGAIVIGGAVLIWKRGKRGIQVLIVIVGLLAAFYVVGLFIAGLTSPPGPPPPMPSSSPQ